MVEEDKPQIMDFEEVVKWSNDNKGSKKKKDDNSGWKYAIIVIIILIVVIILIYLYLSYRNKNKNISKQPEPVKNNVQASPNENINPDQPKDKNVIENNPQKEEIVKSPKIADKSQKVSRSSSRNNKPTTGQKTAVNSRSGVPSSVFSKPAPLDW